MISQARAQDFHMLAPLTMALGLGLDILILWVLSINGKYWP